MCRSTADDLDCIKMYLSENLGETKALGEWVDIINKELPPSRRKSAREIAHYFCVLRKKEEFSVERKICPPRYCFLA